jgi:dTDP-4-dehydrorhamnose 3,5-epimerase-like enzyme
MSLLEKIRLIPRIRRGDARGWLLKVIDGHEEGLPNYTSETYVTVTLPGEVRGNHYHVNTAEWFTVIQGKANVVLCDPASNERLNLALAAANPQTLYAPAGLAHAFENPIDSSEPLIIIAYADHLYDPAETVVFTLVEQSPQ